MVLDPYLKQIERPNEQIMKQATRKHDSLFKPLGSLGDLETIAIRLAGIQQSLTPNIEKKAIIIFCSDNGIWEEEISPNPQSITKKQCENMLNGGASVSILAKEAQADLFVVDIGMKENSSHPLLIQQKIRNGTNNICNGPAMSKNEANEAILRGFRLVRSLKQKGYQVIGTGEMGVCNTSIASAIVTSYYPKNIHKLTSKGAGVSDAGLEKKINCIKKALQCNQPHTKDPVDVLAKLGGFDLAALCGVFIGAAYHKLPVVIDGFISLTAAFLAEKICPISKEFMFPSIRSEEKAFDFLLHEMGLKSYFHLGMRIGEGCGCPFAFFTMDCAVRLMENVTSFQNASVDPCDYIDIRMV